MPVAEVRHPRHELLVAFGRGQLGPEESAAVERHVSDCDVCSRKLVETADDSFVALLRAVAGRARESVSGAVGTVPEAKVPAAVPVASRSVPAAAPVASLVPDELASHTRYRVLGELGRGGMGSVFKAEHLLMERTVALKVIQPHLIQRPDAVERFRREVKAAARLEHPNIVRAYDAEQAGNSHFLVMEFIEGDSLAEVVENRGPLPVTDACRYIRQAAKGLQHAFEQGMVHRDVKPANLMLTRDGQVKILDFGLARFASESGPAASFRFSGTQEPAADGTLTSAGAFMGTPDYAAPEQATNAHAADTRADVYSLGCALYHLLAGRPPFGGGSLAQKMAYHLHSKPTPLAQLRPDVPAELATVLDRMMAKKPSERYQTPAEVVRALAPFAGVVPTVAGPTVVPGTGPDWSRLTDGPPPTKPQRPTNSKAAARRRRRVMTGILAMAVSLLVGAATLGVVVYRIKTDKGEVGVNGRKEQPARDGKSAKSSPKPEPPPPPKPATDPDRRAAEWALSLGGKVSIGVGGEEREVKVTKDLPTSDFQLTVLNLGLKQAKIPRPDSARGLRQQMSL